MLRRTTGGLRKITGLVAPPEQVIKLMVQQIWRYAKKHRDVRIAPGDWQAWWERDATCRHALQAFVLRPEDARGLPTPDKWLNIDYAKDASNYADEDTGSASLLAPTKYIGQRFSAADAPPVEASDLDMNTAVAPPLVDYDDLIQKGLTDSPFLPPAASEDELQHTHPNVVAQNDPGHRVLEKMRSDLAASGKADAPGKQSLGSPFRRSPDGLAPKEF
jgi:hypothetical protein